MDTHWKPIDFQGIALLDNPLIDLLEQHLQEKENLLARTILAVIPSSKADSQPTLPVDDKTKLKLSEAIEAFAKRNYHNGNTQYPLVAFSDTQKAVSEINNALWKYLETLEGSASELIVQLEQIGIEKWHERLSSVVGTIKDMLLHRLEDFVWAVKRLDTLLWRCRIASEIPHTLSWRFQKTKSLWNSLLDSALTSRARTTQALLREQIQKFTKRYTMFLQLQEETERSLDKIAAHTHVLSSLERESRILFLKLHQLLNLWELNQKKKALPEAQLNHALRNILSIDKARSIFREYYNALRNTLFEKSLYIKEQGDELAPRTTANEEMQEVINKYESEAHLLGSTVAQYREFLLRSSTDPFVKMRMGLSDWIVGPEPTETRPVLNLGNNIKTLDNQFLSLNKALNIPVTEHIQQRMGIEREVQPIIQEMSNPLINRPTMHKQVELVLNKLEKFDELASRDPVAIEFMGETLNELLRLDWKYHELFSFPLFHQIYATHVGLEEEVEDRHHAGRMHKFQKLTHQILEWVKARKTAVHAHDIELDVNDIKGYLQDFLGYIQRHLHNHQMTREKALILYQEAFHQLLEYRYLFGNFFHQLSQHESDGMLMRKQFLFVDQYFESIEKHLRDIPGMVWSENETPIEEERHDSDAD